MNIIETTKYNNKRFTEEYFLNNNIDITEIPILIIKFLTPFYYQSLLINP